MGRIRRRPRIAKGVVLEPARIYLDDIWSPSRCPASIRGLAWGRVARMIPWKPAVPLSVLDAVGATTLVRLSRVVPPGCATVLAKLEWENPTGSMKDRMARAVIARAEDDGRL